MPVPPSLAWKLVHISVESGGFVLIVICGECIPKGNLMCWKRHLKESRGKKDRPGPVLCAYDIKLQGIAGVLLRASGNK